MATHNFTVNDFIPYFQDYFSTHKVPVLDYQSDPAASFIYSPGAQFPPLHNYLYKLIEVRVLNKYLTPKSLAHHKVWGGNFHEQPIIEAMLPQTPRNLVELTNNTYTTYDNVERGYTELPPSIYSLPPEYYDPKVLPLLSPSDRFPVKRLSPVLSDPIQQDVTTTAHQGDGVRYDYSTRQPYPHEHRADCLLHPTNHPQVEKAYILRQFTLATRPCLCCFTPQTGFEARALQERTDALQHYNSSHINKNEPNTHNLANTPQLQQFFEYYQPRPDTTVTELLLARFSAPHRRNIRYSFGDHYYTHDSDIVSILHHSGHHIFPQPLLANTSSTITASPYSHESTSTATNAMVSAAGISVILRVLPQLPFYPSTELRATKYASRETYCPVEIMNRFLFGPNTEQPQTIFDNTHPTFYGSTKHHTGFTLQLVRTENVLHSPYLSTLPRDSTNLLFFSTNASSQANPQLTSHQVVERILGDIRDATPQNFHSLSFISRRHFFPNLPATYLIQYGQEFQIDHHLDADSSIPTHAAALAAQTTMGPPTNMIGGEKAVPKDSLQRVLLDQTYEFFSFLNADNLYMSYNKGFALRDFWMVLPPYQIVSKKFPLSSLIPSLQSNNDSGELPLLAPRQIGISVEDFVKLRKKGDLELKFIKLPDPSPAQSGTLQLLRNLTGNSTLFYRTLQQKVLIDQTAISSYYNTLSHMFDYDLEIITSCGCTFLISLTTVASTSDAIALSQGSQGQGDLLSHKPLQTSHSCLHTSSMMMSDDNLNNNDNNNNIEISRSTRRLRTEGDNDDGNNDNIDCIGGDNNNKRQKIDDNQEDLLTIGCNLVNDQNHNTRPITPTLNDHSYETLFSLSSITPRPTTPVLFTFLQYYQMQHILRVLKALDALNLKNIDNAEKNGKHSTSFSSAENFFEKCRDQWAKDREKYEAAIASTEQRTVTVLATAQASMADPILTSASSNTLPAPANLPPLLTGLAEIPALPLPDPPALPLPPPPQLVDTNGHILPPVVQFPDGLPGMPLAPLIDPSLTEVLQAKKIAAEKQKHALEMITQAYNNCFNVPCGDYNVTLFDPRQSDPNMTGTTSPNNSKNANSENNSSAISSPLGTKVKKFGKIQQRKPSKYLQVNKLPGLSRQQSRIIAAFVCLAYSQQYIVDATENDQHDNSQRLHNASVPGCMYSPTDPTQLRNIPVSYTYPQTVPINAFVIELVLHYFTHDRQRSVLFTNLRWNEFVFTQQNLVVRGQNTGEIRGVRFVRR